ncbi:MAG: glycoside hydrolase family 95 protein, partial [Chitinophagaceae bacterium]|nr:glycoside hydrolase family 95 protein [Chitinophagaceae bacterium]
MKKIFFLFYLLFALAANAQNDLKLWYKKPANNWLEALPIGNGRLGAMVYGGTDKETIQLNEESLFAGSNYNDNNPQAAAHIKEIQQLLLNGENNKAHELATKYLLATPSNFRSYQTLGNLVFDFPDMGDVENYTRELDLNNALSKVQFTSGGVRYTREVFASAPDNCIVVHFTCDKPGAITFKTNLYRELDANVQALNDSTLLMDGQIIDAPSKALGEGGAHIKFNTLLKLRANGGVVQAFKNSILVSNANEVTLLLTAATDYNVEKLNFDRSIDAKKKCENIIAAAANYDYADLLNRHKNEYCPKFQNVQLSLGDVDLSNIPTDERLNNFKKSQDDYGLVTLYFQYGRYLLLSSSRYPGVLPANLQGVWNNLYEAPWWSDFHTNINIQMNYWLAGVTNIAETEIPLINFTDK